MKSSLQALVLICAVTALAPLHAQVRSTPLKITDVVLNQSFQIQGQNMALAPDSRSVITTLCDSSKINVAANDAGRMAIIDAAYRSMGCDLWQYGIAGTSTEQLTKGQGNNWSPSWSRDGSRVAYVSDRTGKPQLWVRDMSTGESRQIGDVRLRQWLGYEVPMWLADDVSVLVKLRPETAVDSADPSATLLIGAQKEKVFPGSSVVVFRSPAPAPKPAAKEEASLNTDNALVDLAIINTQTGAVRKLVENASIRSHRLSADGRQLAFLERSKKSPGMFNVYELSVLDLASGKRRLVDAHVSQGFPGAYSFSPDGRKLAYVSTDDAARKAARQKRSVSSNDYDGGGDLYLWDGKSGKTTKVSVTLGNAFANYFLPPLWSGDGARLYLTGANKRVWRIDASAGTGALLAGDYPDTSIVLAKSGSEQVASDASGSTIYVSYAKPDESRNGLAKLDADSGKVLSTLESEQVYGSIFSAPTMTADGQSILFEAQSAHQGADLWVTGHALTGGKRVSTINPQLDQYQFGRSQRVAYTSLDGKPLHGAVLLPSDYVPGKRYPLMLWVYASNSDTSKSVNRFGLVGMDAFNMQMLATRGYVVMFPEIPTNKETPVKDLLNAVNPAIDRLVEMGIADPDRVAVMGNSGGGYSTLALITHSNRFKAAVMNSGFGDLGAFYGTMGGVWIPWLEEHGGAMGVAPWEAPQQYIDNSPFYQLDKVKTPLIIQAGASDQVIIQHSDQVWVGMNKLKKDVIYLRYGGESHVLAGAANLHDYWQRVLEFLDAKMAPAGKTQ